MSSKPRLSNTWKIYKNLHPAAIPKDGLERALAPTYSPPHISESKINIFLTSHTLPDKHNFISLFPNPHHIEVLKPSIPQFLNAYIISWTSYSYSNLCKLNLQKISTWGSKLFVYSSDNCLLIFLKIQCWLIVMSSDYWDRLTGFKLTSYGTQT